MLEKEVANKKSQQIYVRGEVFQQTPKRSLIFGILKSYCNDLSKIVRSGHTGTSHKSSFYSVGRTTREQWIQCKHLLRPKWEQSRRLWGSRRSWNLTSMNLRLLLIMPTRPILRLTSPSRGTRPNSGTSNKPTRRNADNDRYLPIHVPTYTCTYLYMYLPIHVPTYTSTYLYMYLPICMYLYVPTFTYLVHALGGKGRSLQIA